MARMKFLCDAERCIECNGCVTACKQEHEIPWGVNRRRVVTMNEGVPGQRAVSVACMHCTDAPCMAVCPVDCFYHTDEGLVLHDKDLCIGCGYCFYACPFGAPQFPQAGALGVRGKMDKCTFCAGGPEPDLSEAEFKQYGRNRLAEGKLPVCAEMCATKALLGGDGDMIADIYRDRVLRRGKGAEVWGWATAYKLPPGKGTPPPAATTNDQVMIARPVLSVSVALAVAAAFVLTGCGERPQAVVYKQGTYQGKTDQQPWSVAPWNGNKQQWEDAMRQRVQDQNEYKRMGG